MLLINHRWFRKSVLSQSDMYVNMVYGHVVYIFVYINYMHVKNIKSWLNESRKKLEREYLSIS